MTPETRITPIEITFPPDGRCPDICHGVGGPIASSEGSRPRRNINMQSPYLFEPTFTQRFFPLLMKRLNCSGIQTFPRSNVIIERARSNLRASSLTNFFPAERWTAPAPTAMRWSGLQPMFGEFDHPVKSKSRTITKTHATPGYHGDQTTNPR